ECATLVERWEQAREGAGQNVVVLGEAGVGKSRLVYELREHLVAVPHTWLECRGTPYTEGTPFHPVIELLERSVGFAPADPAATKVEKLERALTPMKIALGEAVPLIAEFLGLAAPAGYRPLQMSPELQRRKTMEVVAAWILALAEAQPLALLVEDLHCC